MSEIVHSPECNAEQAKYKAEVEAYKKAWPEHCDQCGGWGGFTSMYDPSPAGVALAPGYMMDFEVCSACVENGKCPRCGQSTFADDTVNICSNCGFDLEHTSKNSPGLPEQPECCCWLNEVHDS